MTILGRWTSSGGWKDDWKNKVKQAYKKSGPGNQVEPFQRWLCQSSKRDVCISYQSLQSIVELPDAHIHIYEEKCPVLPVLLFPDCIGRLVAVTVARRARLFSPPSASEPFPLFFVPIRPNCPIFLKNQFHFVWTNNMQGLSSINKMGMRLQKLSNYGKIH